MTETSAQLALRSSPAEIYVTLANIVREHLDFAEELQPEHRLVEDIGLDSLRMLTLVVEVENAFRICLEEGDEQGVVTVADLANLVGERLAA